MLSIEDNIMMNISCQEENEKVINSKQTWVTLSSSCGKTPGQPENQRKESHPCPSSTLLPSRRSVNGIAGSWRLTDWAM
jgi:hypothetical protein